jgi:hypothetical protein
MSNDCEGMRDEIAGRVAGQGTEQLRLHLDSCAACRDYLRALQREDAALAEYFAGVEADMARREERLRQAVECIDISNQADRISIWRGIMKSRLSKTALAAAILLAAGIGVTYLGGRLDGTSVAWATVAQKLDQIHDFVYRQRQINSSGVKTPEVEFKQEWEIRCYYSSEFGSRWDQYGEMGLIGQFYTQLKQQQFVDVHPRDKTFRCRPEPLPQTTPLDPIGEVRQILAEPYVKLGRMTIDGIRVEGIEVQGQKVGIVRLDDAVSRLWVNVETELPVRMEAEGKIHGSDMHALFIRDQFQWNPGLTEADFTPAITSDFKQEDWPPENSTKQPDIAVASTKEETDVDFGPLQELGLLSDDQATVQPARALTGLEQIHAARDEVMRAWPKYVDLHDALRQELDEKLDLQSCSVDELVQFAVLLREKYWDVGGDLSPTSYRYGYMARVLLETAHAQEPNDLSVGDELAETIMSLETTAGDDFWPVLRELRGRQFRQACAEVEAGRAPVWEDFARGCDLINLLSVERPEEAVPVLDWLMSHAQAGGWTGYGELLERIRPRLAKKGGLGYNIYRPGEFPEEFRYGDRLPSFRGPQKHGAVPVHPLQPEPAQEQNP